MVGMIESARKDTVDDIIKFLHDFQDGDNFIHIESSGDSQNLDLLITHRTREIHDLLPGLLSGTSSGREVSVGGIAIVENSR